MFEKWLIHRVLTKAIKHDGLHIRFWDDETRSYGPNPAVTLHLKDLPAARAALFHGTMGVGEAYASSHIEILGPIDNLAKTIASNASSHLWLEFAGRFLHHPNKNNHKTQKSHIQHHYDLGNSFYRLWLDNSMTYSCAYFRHPSDSLDTAQEQKRAHILRKLDLRPGHRLLDIGSGWGHLLFAAAREYGVQATGITLSREQFNYATAHAKTLGMQDQVHFLLINYQDLAKLPQRFDRIVSVGMFEHVGQGNQSAYFDAIRTLLTPDGLSLLHTISFDREYPCNPWIDRYIFPGGYIPSSREVVNALPDFNLKLLDYENLRMHYAMTLDHWLKRFNEHESEIQAMYDTHFVRMWRLYLAMSAGAFRHGIANLSQFLLAAPQYTPPLTREHIYSHLPTRPQPHLIHQ
jgi:cyclopropane-fatty-acyl-phospholipid synthase